MGRALASEFGDIDYIGDLDREHRSRALSRVRGALTAETRRHRVDRVPRDLRTYARQVERRLDPRDDLVITPSTLPVAYLDCTQPIVIWADATFASMLDFYPEFMELGRVQVRNGHRVERDALERCSLAVYSSEWAARSAVRDYGIDKAKVKVIPFGANLESGEDRDAIKALVAAREGCRLLFLGVDWIRKGGPLAVQITESLRARGIDAHLDVVGCNPDLDPKPEYVTIHGYVRPGPGGTPDVIERLFRQARFLVVPTRAECFGIVFCEASSFGVPSVTTATGGVPSAVRDDVNGYALSPDAVADHYADRIQPLIDDHTAYRALALSAYDEFRSRLNWRSACRALRGSVESLAIS